MARTQQKLHEQVETARGRLGDTVEELAAKADVKQRARKKAADVKQIVEDKTPDRLRHAAGNAAERTARTARTGKRRPVPTATVVGGLGLVLVFFLRRARRR